MSEKKKIKLYSFNKLHAEWMKNPKNKEAYDDLEPNFAIIEAILNARYKKNLSEVEIAKRMGTNLTVLRRLEMGTINPSVNLLKRLTKALGAKLYISIK